MSQRIIILDFGGQYTQLIARRVRQAKVYSYVLPWRTPAELKLLRRYERARQGEWLRMRLATDSIQLLFGRPEPLAAAARNWGMRLFDASGPIKSGITRLAMGTA